MYCAITLGSFCRLFVPFTLYLIGGTAYNAYKGERGLEMLPHYYFWLSVPHLVKVLINSLRLDLINRKEYCFL